MSSAAQAAGPSPFLTLLEGRSFLELGSFYSVRPLLKRLPKGDGHPVIVLPGFLASHYSTRPMRRLLHDLGYEAYDWGLGRNLRFNEHREAEMLSMLKRAYLRHGRKVSLIGWSLGGVFARELAKPGRNLSVSSSRSAVPLPAPTARPVHGACLNASMANRPKTWYSALNRWGTLRLCRQPRFTPNQMESCIGKVPYRLTVSIQKTLKFRPVTWALGSIHWLCMLSRTVCARLRVNGNLLKNKGLSVISSNPQRPLTDLST